MTDTAHKQQEKDLREITSIRIFLFYKFDRQIYGEINIIESTKKKKNDGEMCDMTDEIIK